MVKPHGQTGQEVDHEKSEFFHYFDIKIRDLRLKMSISTERIERNQSFKLPIV